MNTQTKIPTVFALLLLFLLLGGVVLVSETISRNARQEAARLAPINVEVTNLSDTTFSVSWQTQIPTTANVIVGSPKLPINTFIDDRDTAIGADQKSMGTRTTHHITLKKLNPNTQYTWFILSGGKKYQNTNGPWATMTGPTLAANQSAFEPSYGTVAEVTGAPAADALVYLTLDGSQTLSTYVNPSGSWLVALSAVRTADAKRYQPFAERTAQTIRIVHAESEAEAVTDTQADSPVPVIVLGKSYDFRKTASPSQQVAQANPQVLGQQTGASSPTPTTAPSPTSTSLISPSPTVSPLPTPSPTRVPTPTPTINKNKYPIAIVQPKKGANLTSTLPLIQGIAIPGENVLITIPDPNPLSTSVQTGTDGIFRYTPTRTLAPGKQSVTITTLGGNGKPTSLTTTYNIFKSGTQVLGDATASATLAATPTTRTTISPTPSTADESTPTPTPPVSGTAEITALGIVLGLGLLAAGAFILLK